MTQSAAIDAAPRPLPVPPVISRNATMARLGVSLSTVERYIERGHLRAHRDPASGRIGVEVASIAELEARRVIV